MATLGMIDDLLIKYVEILENIKTNNKASIYHYTSSAGFKNILQNHNLWFSNIKYLNDEQEIIYAENLTIEIAENLYKDNKNPFLKLIIDKKISPTIKFTAGYLFSQKQINRDNNIGYKLPHSVNSYIKNKFDKNLKFVACFSEYKDNLSLWNYYSKSENKNGYNIGFNKESLLNDLKKQELNFIHGKVIYDSKKQKQILKDLILDCSYIYNDFTPVQEREKSECINAYWEILEICSMFFKNQAFSSEKEYRIILDVNNYENQFKCKNFREYNGIFIPYIEALFDKKIIDSVSISPTMKQEIIKKSTEYFLECNDYDIQVMESKIPVRY